MIDIHHFLVRVGMLLMLLLSFLLVILGSLAILDGDWGGIIGIIIGALFLIIDIVVIKMYKRDAKSFLRWDIYVRASRDAFVPIFLCSIIYHSFYYRHLIL